jgi:site-specific recombinase XerD
VPSRVVSVTSTARVFGEAAAAFLAQPGLASSTRRSYRQTLGRLERELGTYQPLATLTAGQVTNVVTGAWAGRAPATWNRHVATVRSFVGFSRRRRWLVDDLAVHLERRPEPVDRTKAIPLPELEQLWRGDDVGVREKVLWRLLYETAARASEVLSVNVEDLELDNKRVRVRSKGGDTDWLHFQTGSARLLPRLIAGRTHGLLFLADRRPVPARAPANAHDHQAAQPGLLQPHPEVDAVGPDVHVVAVGQVTLAGRLVVSLPAGQQPTNGRG